MKAVLTGVVATTLGALSHAGKTEVTPVQKVIQLLEGMSAKGKDHQCILIYEHRTRSTRRYIFQCIYVSRSTRSHGDLSLWRQLGGYLTRQEEEEKERMANMCRYALR